MFKLNGSADERRKIASEFRDALMALPGIIPVLRSMEVGLNQNPAESWDVVLTAVVDKMEDVPLYANHPAHVSAASIVKPHAAGRACVDYEC